MAYSNQSFNGYGQQQQMQMQQMGMQPMQQGWYQQPAQMPMQQSQMPAAMPCRLVSCIEEVKASPADLSGEPALFYNPHAGIFYTKALDRATGRTTVQAYGRLPEQEQTDQITAQLMGRVQKLEEIIAEAQRLGSVRAQKRGAAADE